MASWDSAGILKARKQRRYEHVRVNDSVNLNHLYSPLLANLISSLISSRLIPATPFSCAIALNL